MCDYMNIIHSVYIIIDNEIIVKRNNNVNPSPFSRAAYYIIAALF